MLFNSIDFAFFLPIVFILYWFMTNGNLKAQNILIVAASCLFYGWWNWHFLVLLLFSTTIDYLIGIALKKQENNQKRKLLLFTSLFLNLSFLFFFKYYNFFIENFIAVFSFFGSEIQANTLNIILPVGISFYTFQIMSYNIDVYKRKLAPTTDWFAFSAFVCFFPQLVAGPIERASNLLPQFYKKRSFNYELAVDGLRQILWGLFKKVVIADNCAEYANLIFNNSDEYYGSTLVIGALFFSFQIYCDFSGYSDIAIGTSRLFGFELMRNFHFPYFSRNIAEFWRNWHISLSTWFRDYIFIPLGGNRGSIGLKIRNIFIIFIISGFWHGANWTFVIWGILNAIYFLPSIIMNNRPKQTEIIASGKYLPSPSEFISILTTFTLTTLGWIFFRAKDLRHAIQYIYDMVYGLSLKSGYVQTLNLISSKIGYTIFLFLLIFILIEWIGREGEFGISQLNKMHKWPGRYFIYYAILIAILWFGGKQQQFIYFQF